ncbi:MAG TPA: UDP-N-acetylmuramoyl-tripeptide--D-alanyl-D-alanine ligase [Bacteroidales bacterium]|nr:UDP-N-acetylmuramoyl-tripeptide--D-alanyl-D-alanine ligase [Bacteroidales bacterium]
MKLSLDEIYNIFINSAGISIDSRSTKSGQIFLAIKGENSDGNSYVEDAFNSGAMYCITNRTELLNDNRCIIVSDTYQTLVDLAKMHRKHFSIPVLAITGSNGKTTSKELIAKMLSTKYNVLFTEGNLNNELGLPLTILKLNKTHEIAVVEMGAAKLGDINLLCEIAKPTHGLITTIGRAHIGRFGSFENIIKAKTELFDFLRKHNGLAFINEDDPILKSFAHSLNTIFFGINNPNTQVSNVSAQPFLSFEWIYNDKKYKIKTHFFGDYNLVHTLAAISIGLYFNISPENIVKAITEYLPTNSRSQIIYTDKNIVIMDAYNANPTSMEAALKNFFSIPIDFFYNQNTAIKPKKIATILGEMMELGEYSYDEHKNILNIVNSYNPDIAIFVGDNFYQFKDNFPQFLFVPNTKELINFITNNPLSESIVLVKGSRANALEKILPYL